ncbi:MULTISPECIES: dTDP-4-dehydrorhamnose 3,5-epimerase [unclassified Vibrio]|uniref:dTDP-4-dehydrorhamnose 3,5-epimerase n=1 Tax=unclassified Vibrio TaxID=2614977 RepID=UPI00354CB463
MKVIDTRIPGVKIIEPKIFDDERGSFMETWQKDRFAEMVTGYPVDFVQDNQSYSKKNVLRGLHYQSQKMQGKLIRVVSGSILDVAVDIRYGSKTFGEYISVELSAENQKQLWIPKGFAHGFLTLSESAVCIYKASDYYHPEYEKTIAWNDKDLNIDWGTLSPTVSDKDNEGISFKNFIDMR